MGDLDHLDFYASQEGAKAKIQAVLDSTILNGIFKVHALGYDWPLRQCELVWKPISSKATHILGLSEDELPRRWVLTDKRRQIELDLLSLRQAIQKAFDLGRDED